MKKIISLLLALILAAGCLSVMAGCSENGADDKKDETPQADGTPTDGQEEEETEWIDPFADTDFDGRSFRVSSSIDENDATNADYLIRGPGELNGEAVNDAVFNRNQKIAELLNI